MTSCSFTIDDLAALTDPQWFARGEKYFAEGLVSRLRCDPGRAAAVVQGSRVYPVRLRWESGHLIGVCECPIGADGHVWCEHAVATALAWLDHLSAAPASSQDQADQPDDAELADFLAAQESAWLAEQLTRIADEDPVIWIRLAAAAGSEEAVIECRDLLEETILSYEPFAQDWSPAVDGGAAKLRRAVNLLDDLLEYGFTEQVVELAQDAYELLSQRCDGVDDDHATRLAEIAVTARAIAER